MLVESKTIVRGKSPHLHPYKGCPKWEEKRHEGEIQIKLSQN